eukprot:375842-Prymnesium_polylepis.2
MSNDKHPGSWHPRGQPASLNLKRLGLTQGARSPVDLERRSRRNQGFLHEEVGVGHRAARPSSKTKFLDFGRNARGYGRYGLYTKV